MLQPYGPNAPATRLMLASRASRNIDGQYYLLRPTTPAWRSCAPCATPRRVACARLLIDDFYAAGKDATLLAPAQPPGVEVRQFNPGTAAREQTWMRFLAAAFDFSRVNRRMHNSECGRHHREIEDDGCRAEGNVRDAPVEANLSLLQVAHDASSCVQTERTSPGQHDGMTA